MKRILILLLFLAAAIRSVHAESDDITLMGKINPVYSLKEPFSERVLTSGEEELQVQISDIAAEKERILIRFFIADLPERWKAFIDDDQRLYGSYLPAAELVLSDSSILTPSSASKYSFLEYNSRLIIGGLFVFNTEKTPQSFYLNFNQIPFDTKPLLEGFSKAVILSPSEDTSRQSSPPSADFNDGLEFTLTAAAQTTDLTMLQPAVRMETENEILSKFGWISITDTADGRRFSVTRDNIYGFNLADDSLYAPAHAYFFKALSSDTPVEVSMDHAYVVRSFDHPRQHTIDLLNPDSPVLLQEDRLFLRLTDIETNHEESRIRLFLESGETVISDISFKFKETGGTTPPPVTCGSTPESKQFACDLYFSGQNFPARELSFYIDAVEYRKEGPWSLRWDPVPMDVSKKPEKALPDRPFFPEAQEATAYPTVSSEIIHSVLEKITDLSRTLSSTEGWIHERSMSVYRFTAEGWKDLIPVSQADMYLTEYTAENWYHAGPEGKIDRIIAVIRDTETNAIRSAQLQEDGSVLDLLHALYSRSGASLPSEYSCYREFTEISNSSAVFVSDSPCVTEGRELRCLSFSQSLNGIQNSPGSQEILFTLDPDSLLIRDETITYGQRSLTLYKSIREPEKKDSLPEEIANLIGSIK